MPYIGNPPAERFTSFAYQDLTGGSGTSFTLDNAVGNPQEIEVFVNNVRQEPGVAYTVSGTALTMTGSIATTDDFYVVFQGKAIQTATHPSDRALTATDGTFTNGLTVDDDGAVALTVDRATSDGNVAEFQQDGTTLAQIGALGVRGYFAADNAGISPYQNVIYPTNGTGTAVDNTVDIGHSSYRPKDLYLSGNLYIGGTGSANALDDYEEGTFTPTVSGGYGSAPSYTAQTGIYTKIGKLVLAHIRIAVASGSRGGGALTFVGLPFTNQSTIDGGGFPIYQSNFHSTGEFYPMVNANTATVFFHEANGTSISANELDADSYDIRIAVVYQTA